MESLTGDHAFLESIGHAIDVAEGKAMSVPLFIEYHNAHTSVGLIMSSVWSGIRWVSIERFAGLLTG